MKNTISRRDMINSSAVALFGILIGCKNKVTINEASVQKDKLPFKISLNTSTIRAYNLTIDEQINMVADAGFDGIELWIRDVQGFLDKGGKSSEIKGLLQDRNLHLDNMIGFSQWCSENNENREKAVIQMRDEMLLTAELGGQFIAAPFQGVPTLDKTKFDEYTARYLRILKIAEETGVVPIIELWGHGVFHSLADCAQLVIATGHPKASMLLDFYHLYRGGNSWETLDYINGAKLPVIHINDYPSSPEREQLKDSDRVFPGDGICPFNQVLPRLYHAGFRGSLSVELFNQGYWDTMNAKEILEQSYKKTYDVIQNAMIGINS
mgnify:CR=1 FL=1|jgi:2-keto-myo-inositol isomerase